MIPCKTCSRKFHTNCLKSWANFRGFFSLINRYLIFVIDFSVILSLLYGQIILTGEIGCVLTVPTVRCLKST